MPNDIATEFLRRMLEGHPRHAYVLPDGSALAGLAGPDLKTVLIILAPDGKNFQEMTDEQVNEYICTTLSK